MSSLPGISRKAEPAANGIEADVHAFQEMLCKACRAISQEYMLLPVHGVENPQYRERVYCYELYHQVRLVLEDSRFPYFAGGEIDKTGHPLIRNNHLDQVKPDLAIHIPGDMGRNLCVVEAKPVNLQNDELLADDLRKLTSFRLFGQYQSACFLLYGQRAKDSLETVAARVSAAANRQTHRKHISLPLLTCYWHRNFDKEPTLIPHAAP